MKENIIVKLIELNNKSRKGLYYYIKKKGYKPTYLKFNPDFNLDSYIEYYNDVFVKRDKTKFRKIKTYNKAYSNKFTKKDIKKYPHIYKKANKYIKNLKKKSTINQIIKKGLTQVKIDNIKNIGNSDIFKKTKMLLKPLVKDKQLLSLLATEENISKLKNRIETIVEFRDKQGRLIAITRKIGFTPKTSINKLIYLNLFYDEIDSQDPYGDFSNKLILKGFNTPKILQSGIINKISVKFVFRKGK